MKTRLNKYLRDQIREAFAGSIQTPGEDAEIAAALEDLHRAIAAVVNRVPADHLEVLRTYLGTHQATRAMFSSCEEGGCRSQVIDLACTYEVPTSWTNSAGIMMFIHRPSWQSSGDGPLASDGLALHPLVDAYRVALDAKEEAIRTVVFDFNVLLRASQTVEAVGAVWPGALAFAEAGDEPPDEAALVRIRAAVGHV